MSHTNSAGSDEKSLLSCFIPFLFTAPTEIDFDLVSNGPMLHKIVRHIFTPTTMIKPIMGEIL